MDRLLLSILSNSALALLLAIAAFALSRLVRKPALVHALWVLVLLKLITPALWQPAIPWNISTPDSTPSPLPADAPYVQLYAQAPADALATMFEGTPDDELTAAEAHVADAAMPGISYEPPPPGRWITMTRLYWKELLIASWGLGSVICSLAVLRRTREFRRLLGFAEPADAATVELADRLARRIGLPRAPAVCVVPGEVCPMVWGLGRWARVLVPASLWESLDDDQRAGLLLHELAHIARGDHWVRLLELLVTVLCWWNPLLWWARRELREAEEQCCDAAVVAAMPGRARHYATTLLQTIEFATRARTAGLAPASGMGQFHDLKRRLTMIKTGCIDRRLGPKGLAAMWVLGMLALPIAPTLAQSEPASAPEAAPPPPEPANPYIEQAKSLEKTLSRFRFADDPAEVTAADPVADEPAQVDPEGERSNPGPDIAPADRVRQVERQQAQAEAQHAKAQLAAAEARLRELSNELRRAEQRLAELSKREADRSARLERQGRDIAVRQAPAKVAPGAIPVAPAPPQAEPAAPPVESGVQFTPKNPPTAQRIPARAVNPNSESVLDSFKQADPEQRLDQLEERLELALQELQRLRKDLKKSGHGEAPPPTPATRR